MAGGLNLYGYANGDPVNFRDPSGLSACDGYDDVASCLGGAWDGSNSNDGVIIFDDDCDGLWSCLRALALMEWRGLLAGADPTRTGLTEREGSLGALLGRFSLVLPTAWRARPPVAAPSAFTGSLDDVFANPNSLRGLSPLEVQSIFTEATSRGWQYGTLRRGSAQGLGIRVWDGGNRMISWHPGGGHHGASPYWKVSQTGAGTVRVPAGGASPWAPPPWAE